MSQEDVERLRDNWLDHVRDVIRSRHYVWLPEGLAGEPVDVAMLYLLTDIQHVCRRAGVDFDAILLEAREKYAEEEAEAEDEPYVG